MEIKEHPSHKKITFAVGCPLFVIALACAATGFYAQEVLHSSTIVNLSIYVFLGCFVAMVCWFSWRAYYCTCPKCHRRLGLRQEVGFDYGKPGTFLCHDCHIAWHTGIVIVIGE